MDSVDHIRAQWSREKPDLDTSPMAVIGRLSQASALVDAQLARTFAMHGIDAPTFDVLATLTRQGPPYHLTPVELAEGSMISSSAVAQRLNRLEAQGLVRRAPNPRDARSKIVQLTQAGRDLLDATLPDHLATEENLLTPLTAADRATLADLLERLMSRPSRDPAGLRGRGQT